MEGPIIGVTAGSPSHGEPYAEAVRRAGGTPWLVLPGHELTPAETLGRMAALLVSGGPDLSPAWYGGAESREGDFDRARDAVEVPLLRAALEIDMPVLGICRGMQALNVAAGGRLIADIPGHDSTERDGVEVPAYHRIFIAPGSRLAATVGAGGFVRVNSLHHQGLREAQRSPRLLASAYSIDDGIIEAVEDPERDWVVGVQFHPERRREVPPQFGRLFEALVERARR